MDTEVIDINKRYIKLSLSNTPHYTTKISIGGVLINMQCGYNTRNKSRWIILTNRNNETLLPQTFLKSKKRCELNFLSNQYDLDYFITLSQIDKSKVFTDDYDYLYWAKDFELFFVGRPYETTEKLDRNLRKLLVGN